MRVVRSPERWLRIVEVAAEYGEILPNEPDSRALEEFLAKRHRLQRPDPGALRREFQRVEGGLGGMRRVAGDRTLPLIFADFARQAGITVECDPGRWVNERRQKSTEEIDHLREAQHITEGAIQRACELIASATARPDGVLIHEGQPLTSERVRAAVDHWLLDHNFVNPMAIIAGGVST